MRLNRSGLLPPPWFNLSTNRIRGSPPSSFDDNIVV
ncbi:hypothetical protein VPH1235_0074 [Vibrio phage 1235]